MKEMSDLDLLGVLFAKYIQNDKKNDRDLVAMKFLCDRLSINSDTATGEAVSEIKKYLKF